MMQQTNPVSGYHRSVRRVPLRSPEGLAAKYGSPVGLSPVPAPAPKASIPAVQKVTAPAQPPKPAYTGPKFQWQNEHKMWLDYDPPVSKQCEIAFQQHKSQGNTGWGATAGSVGFQVGKFRYNISIDSGGYMYQENTQSNMRRNVRRVTFSAGKGWTPNPPPKSGP